MTDNLSAALEAMLFAAGEPVEVEKIAQVLEIDIQKAIDTAEQLKADYKKRLSGLRIVKMENAYQICSAKEYIGIVRELLELKRNTPLSQAAFEVLAIVAYNQPVTKAFIEQVRGVDCSGVIRSLTEKGLVDEAGRLDLPGRPLLYETTNNFLRCFSMESLDELPELPEKQENDDENKNQITFAQALNEDKESVQ